MLCALGFVLPTPAVHAGCAHEGLDEKLILATRAIQADPDEALLYVERAELHRLHRDWAATAQDLDTAEQLDRQSSDPAARVRVTVEQTRARTALDRGRLEHAERAWNRVLMHRPRHLEALQRRAAIHAETGRPARAVWGLSLAIEHAEHPDPTLYVERARASLRIRPRSLGVEVALAGLEAGLERLGSVPALELEALGIEQRARRWHDALARATRLAAGQPRVTRWHVVRAELLLRFGRVFEAREVFEHALSRLEAAFAGRRPSPTTTELRRRCETGLSRLGYAPSSPPQFPSTASQPLR